MHATQSKRAACERAPWQHRDDDRRCEHGDSRLLAEQKRQRRLALRRADRAAASER